MKIQHTPGPWNVLHVETKELKTDHFVHQFQIITPNTVEHDNGIGQATARLIAAAPELLEACVKAFDNLRNGESKTKYRLIECLNSLEEAIKKAKGE